MKGSRAVLASLKRPDRLQRFLDEEVAYNKEEDGETCRSPRRVLEERLAHCLEGALFAAAVLRFHGRRPLVVQMRAEPGVDEDHLLALFRENGDSGAWGAVAKSKFTGLRFREPVYRTIRELAMSYFEQYFSYEAVKSLRAVSRPVDLSRFDGRDWENTDDDLHDVAEWLAHRPMTPLVTRAQARGLALVDPLLFRAGPIDWWGKPVRAARGRSRRGS
jgi:hypothetical protein